VVFVNSSDDTWFSDVVFKVKIART
jgi:hypothetical protein